jgi:pimeloyl-ACP methyl ester carboxylesterase
VPTYTRGDAEIHYEERGSGFPLLLLAPGGMRSTIDYWKHAALNPWESYTADFRLIALDQRNAGSSRGPLDVDDPWGMFARDQLGLLDHLGVDRFLVLGCCIGGSFILKLVEQAPERIVGAVLEQPIGVQDDNRALFASLQTSWADELAASRSDLEPDRTRAFLAAMWNADFVVSVDNSVIERCPVPLLVLPGIDDYHPTDTGRAIARMAPDAEVIEPWKDTPENVALATERVRLWLHSRADAAEGRP